MNGIDVIHSVVKQPLMALPVATPLVHIGDRHVLISPGSRITEADYRAMGPVTDIVAPNMFHAAGVPGAMRFFPEARRWGVPGLAAHRKDITWTDELRADTWPFADELPLVEIAGMPRLREVVFLHRATRTLIATDMAFNVLDGSGIGSWIVGHVFGTYHRFGVSRVLNLLVKDRAAVQASLDRVFALDFDRLIVSHGSEVTTGAKAVLAAAVSERGFSAQG